MNSKLQPNFCSNCGAQQLRPNARFCHVCGQPIPAAPVVTPEPAALAPTRSRRLSAWWLLPLFLVAAVALVFVAWAPARSGVANLLAGIRPDATQPASRDSEAAQGATSGDATAGPVGIVSVTPAETPVASPTVSTPPSATPRPTATPPPTATPTPTATPPPTATPTLTATPTAPPAPTAAPTALPCRIAAGNKFQALWGQQRARLGCALNQPAQSDAATERFQNGRMIWRKNNDMIYVLYDDGDWATYPDISVDGAPEPEGFQPPAGLYTPVRGFGATWRAELGGTAARIGWATQDEYGVSVQFQDFEKGLMLEMEDKVYLLGDNGGRWLAP